MKLLFTLHEGGLVNTITVFLSFRGKNFSLETNTEGLVVGLKSWNMFLAEQH